MKPYTGEFEFNDRDFLMAKLEQLDSIEAIDKFVPIIVGELIIIHDRRVEVSDDKNDL